jgi:hypothetical protein
MKTEEDGGSIIELMRELLAAEKETGDDDNVVDIKSARSSKTKAKSAPLPSDKQIRAWMDDLASNERMLEYLHHERGLDDETIERFQIGWDSTRPRGRLTVPIYGPEGELVNVRLYDRKPPNRNVPKMIPFASGYGTQVYGFDSLLGNDEIVLCEGEWDRIINEQNGIPTATTTAGAGAFQLEWAKWFRDKHVFICYDEDQAGIDGALRTAKMLKDVAAGVYIMTNLGTGLKGGDLTDYWVAGSTESQFRSLMEEARERPFAASVENHVIPTTGLPVSVERSQDFSLREPLELHVTISGKQVPPYGAPREFVAECDQGKGKVCAFCPMAAFDGRRKVTTNPDDPRLLQFIESNDMKVRILLQEQVGANCSTNIGFEVQSNWNIEELMIQQSVEERTEETTVPMDRKIFNVGTYDTRINTGARIVGSQTTDPRNQRGLFHSWHLEPVQSNIDKFKMTPELRAELAVFQNDPFQDPIDKCVDIAEDLAANVTRIYGRPWMHVAFDLVWHSVMAFDAQGIDGSKGWLDVLVVGDTRTGKSATAKALAHHYNAGVVKSCEGATFSGLVGGNKEMPQGRGMMVKWGVIPLNDRRLVVLDELSGIAEKNILADMSSVRSSGVAQITKIADGEASARTRLLWLSNPVDGRPIAETAEGGMGVIKNLVKNNEDIARFDFAFTVAKGEVASEIINTNEREPVEHVYTSELCSKLVMWAWSRKANQIRFTRGADQYVLEVAEELGSLYVPDPPLVQVENIREKIARIAVAIAARTFSTNKSGEMIVVKPEHVDNAAEFLKQIYGSESMGYLAASQRIREDRFIAEQKRATCIRYLTHETNAGLLEALRTVATAASFRPRDFEEFGGGFDPRAAVMRLREWRMLRRLTGEGLNGRIAMEPTLIQILRELERKEHKHG